MAFSLTWMEEVLKAAGLKIALVDGWKDRGRAEAGETLGVLCHHTAGPKTGNMPSLKTLIDGRPDLPGPLAQLGLGRDGTYYLIAAGRCNHAGAGRWMQITTGNTNFIGIEAENTGLVGDPWPSVQLDAYARGAAALLKYAGRSADFCAGHKEYALPKGRKDDPSFDMTAFRATVNAFINGAIPVHPLIPAIEVAGVGKGRPTLRRGDTGELVKEVQRKVGTPVFDGAFGPKTEAAVREFQRVRELVPDGIIGPKTWAVLDTIAA